MPMYPSGHENPGVAAIILLLDDWHLAQEDGTVINRMPDPSYVRPNGQELWSEEKLDALMNSIDKRIAEEVTRLPGTSEGATATTDFISLPFVQKLALAQQLEALSVQYDAELKVNGL